MMVDLHIHLRRARAKHRKKKTAAEKKAVATQAGKAFWAKLTPKERSAEMKRAALAFSQTTVRQVGGAKGTGSMQCQRRFSTVGNAQNRGFRSEALSLASRNGKAFTPPRRDAGVFSLRWNLGVASAGGGFVRRGPRQRSPAGKGGDSTRSKDPDIEAWRPRTVAWPPVVFRPLRNDRTPIRIHDALR